MQNFVISLTTAYERRQHIVDEFGKNNISYEFFDAITPEDIDSICQDLNLNLTDNKKMSLGEKACFLSHVCLWQKMIDEKIAYMAIFEDDIYLGKDANHFLNNFEWLKKTAPEVGLVKLETFLEKVHYGHPRFHYKNRDLSILKSSHSGAAGYIIGFNECILFLKYLRTIEANDFIAIDHLLFSQYLSLSAYQLLPGICIQSDRLTSDARTFESSLEVERSANKNKTMKEQRSFKHYLKKYKRSIGKRTIYKIVPFK